MSKKHADIPKWRKDFPVEWGADNYVSRREMTKFLVLASGAMCLGNGYVAVANVKRREETYPEVTVATVDELPVGGVKQFQYPTPDLPAILIRMAEDVFVAYPQKCTHLSCAVIPDTAHGRFHCPCHNGSFDLATGAPIAGPPRRPLERVLLEIRNGDLYATGIEVRA